MCKSKSHLICSFCGYQATQKGSLNTHVRSLHLGIKYECKHCGIKLSTKASLNSHIDLIHNMIPRKGVDCKECGKFMSKGNLKFHINSVHEKIRYKCNQCNNEFTQESSLRMHVKRIQDNLNLQSPKCE